LECALNESKENPMGDHLLLQWLGTRRGLAVFVLLLLITVFSNLCRLSEGERGKQTQQPAKVKASQRI
jgi:hypothetical protein